MSNFFFFHNVFYSVRKIVSPFINIFDIISLFAAELEQPKIGMWGKELKDLLCRQVITSACVGKGKGWNKLERRGFWKQIERKHR